jgi:DNA-binding IclR family transcriptional regulator
MARTPRISEDSIKAAEELRDSARTVSEFRRAVSVILYADDGNNYTAEKLGEIFGVSRPTVFDDLSRVKNSLDSSDPDKPKGPGGRRNSCMSIEDERAFLERWEHEAVDGRLLSVTRLHEDFNALVGRRVSKTTIYELLRRHDWIKAKPDAERAAGDRAALDDRQNNPRFVWIKPASTEERMTTSTRLLDSVARALDILDVLDANGEMTNTSVARLLGMEKSTVFRTLNTLVAKNYVRQDPETLKYSIGYKLFEMGHNVARRTGLPKQAFRFMRRLANICRGAINLGVLDGDKIVYIDKIESDETVKACMKIGQGIPLHCTGLGKAHLAHMSREAVKALIGPGPYQRYTDNTMTAFDDLVADLSEVRRLGYAIDDEEHLKGIVCVAAPAFNSKGEVIAALSVAVLKNLVNDSEVDAKILGHAVYEAAEGLTVSVGGRRPGHL